MQAFLVLQMRPGVQKKSTPEQTQDREQMCSDSLSRASVQIRVSKHALQDPLPAI